MQFTVFRRDDRALVVVPALFTPPLAADGRSGWRTEGSIEVDLAAFSDAFVLELGTQGCGVAGDADARLVEAALAEAGRSVAPAPG